MLFSRSAQQKKKNRRATGGNYRIKMVKGSGESDDKIRASEREKEEEEWRKSPVVSVTVKPLIHMLTTL